MGLHTARVIPEKRFSCPPAAVHFAGVEKEVDMLKIMHQIEIEYIGNEVIAIRQGDGPEYQEITITTDQAEVICKWIMEAAQEAARESNEAGV